ncbi:SusC/RagA family TonB-linked outer membrane protein [uncultured Allomuricauda sp.]|uniref:SusC/RagA family TonB-linked outer membrane protein n=1 Tax=Flagellimonas sp. W118 TaxID=3410791 RepID=UPI0026255A20|nr:TonB-dependent receptor [uncultured Allomuricauda sp.]
MKKGVIRLYGVPMIFVFLFQITLAQNRVSGVVVDSNNQAIPGANIVEKGTANGVVSDFDGNFVIEVADGGILVVSYIGFVTREIRVDGQSTINIVLGEDLAQLDEVVVIGYGTQRKEQISGSVASIDVDEITKIPQVSIDQLIQGRAAGVAITQNSGRPGGAVSVRIRGVGSVNASSEPLYIIDGVPVSGDANNISGSGRSVANSSGPLSSLNPNDIQSIDILKDASATAIYGSRASNGVVIITTKTGRKETGKLTYNGYTAFQQPTNILPVLDLPGYATLQNEMRRVFQQSPRLEFADPSILGPGTNWQKEIFTDAVLQNHQLSFSGGSEKTQYYLSAALTDQEGIVQGSGFQRGSARINLDTQIRDNLKVGVNITASRTDEDIVANGNSRGIVALALRNNPETAVFNPDGSFAGPVTAEQISLAVPNPIAQQRSLANDLRRDVVLGSAYAQWEFIKGLTYKIQVGGNFNRERNRQFQSSFSYGAISLNNPQLTEQTVDNTYSVVTNTLTLNKTFGDKHNLTLLGGHETQRSSYDGIRALGIGFVDERFSTLNNAQTFNSTQFKGSSALESYFTRAIYSFDDRYSVTASFRADGSSKFAEGNKWGYFPSVSAAWRLSNESFMEGFDIIQNIKLYGGYGEVGNQDLPNNPDLSLLGPTITDLGTGFRVTSFGNPNVRWETSKQINLGADFSVWDGKINTTVEVYRKLSSDFLFRLALTDFVLGGNSSLNAGSVLPPFVNLGEMENKGIDVTLNIDAFNNEDFGWNSAITFSHYRNEVLDLNGVTTFGNTNLDDTLETVTRTIVGEPIGVFYGYKVDGLFRSLNDLNNAPQQFGQPVGDASVAGRTWLGDIKFEDVNGDGVVDGNDRTQIGNPHPDFTFSLQNNFRYKGFSLGVFLQGSYGNDIFNAVNRSLTGTNLTFRNQLDSVLDYWTPANPDATHPRYTLNQTPNIFISDRYIEDGSYLRIQNVRLGYAFPSKLIDKTFFSSVNVYGSIQNLYTFTNYSGYDPDIGSLGQSPILAGIDNGRYPLPRTFTFGVDVSF